MVCVCGQFAFRWEGLLWLYLTLIKKICLRLKGFAFSQRGSRWESREAAGDLESQKSSPFKIFIRAEMQFESIQFPCSPATDFREGFVFSPLELWFKKSTLTT